MGTTLTGKTIASTYTSLLKISDNGNVGGTIKRISDGAGNDSSVYLSSTQLLFSAGSASVPGLSINGTATTGLYAPSDNEIGITISGTQRGLFTSSGLTVTGYLKVTGAMYDSNDSAGTSNQVLTSTGSATDWKTLSEIAGVDGTGTAKYLSKWSDSDTIANSILYEDSAKIGINNTSPQSVLDLGVTSTNSQVLNIRTNSNSRIGFGVNASYGMRQYGPSDIGATSQLFQWGTIASSDGTTYSDLMNLLTNGNLGLGVTTPSSTIGYAKVLEIKGASSGIAFSTTSYNNFEIGTGSDSKLTISDGGSERMSIASDGTTTFGVAGAVVKVLPSSGQARFLIESPSVNGNNVYLALKSPDTEWRWITNRGDLNSGNQGDLFLREETAGVNVLNFETNNGNATFAGSLKVSTIAQIGSDTDKFLMSDGGLIKYVSGANLLSYIGAAPSSGGAYLPLAGGTMTGHLILNNAVELQSKNAAGTAKTIARITSGDVLQYGWSGSGEVQFMGGGAYTKRMGITTDGQIEITSDDTHTPFIINHAGDITPHAAGRGQLSIIGNSYEGWIALDGTAMYIGNNSSSRDLVLQTNTTDRLTIDGSTGNATFAGNVTVSSSTNRSIILDYTSGSGGYSWMSFKQSGTEQFRVFGAYGSDYLSFYNDQNSVGHQLTLAADGKVGIGTVGPAKPLHISSADNQPLRVESTDAYSGIEIKDNGSSTLPPLISALSDDFIFYGGHGSTRPAIMFMDSSTGNVGIGETTPDKKLDVYTATNTDGIRAWGPATNLALMLKNTGSNGSDWNIASTGGGHGYGDGSLQFGIAYGVPKVTFKSDGTVGIGTYAPASKLTLSDTSTDSIVQTRFINDARDYALGVHGGLSDSFVLYDDTANETRLVVDTSGKVGIGTVTPTNIIHTSTSSNVVGRFESTDATAYIRINDTDDSFYLVTAGQKGSIGGNADVNANNLNIDLTNGDVGIGTASPAQQLHIQDNSGGGVILLERQDSSTSGTMGEILFGSRDYDDSLASIKAVMAGSTTSGKLVFSTEATSAALTTALTLNADQSATFAGSATIETGINLESGTLLIKNATGDSNGLRIYQDSSDTARIYNYYDGPLVLGQNNAAVITIGADTNTTFAGQVTVNEDWVSNEGSLSIVHSQNTLGGIGIVANGVYKGGLIQRDGTSGDFTELTTYTSQPLKLRTNNTDAVTIDTSQNATFAGDVSTTGDLTASQLTIDDYIYHAGNTNTYIYFETDSIKLRTGGTDRLTLNSAPFFNDKLGVGMTPVEVLDIKTASGDCRMRLDAPASSDTEIKFFNAGVAQYTIGHDDATDNFVIGGANVDAPMVSVDKSGHVGIGTTPQNILHVHQSDASEHSYVHITQEDGGSASTDGMSIGVLDGGVNASVRLRENGYLNFFTNNTERMRIASSGNVEIKTTNGEINFDSGNGYVQTTTGSTSLVFGVNSSEKIRIHSSGNVGIGGLTAPPSVFAVKGSQTYGMARLIPSSANGEVAIGFFADTAGTTTGTSWVAGVGGWGNTNKFVIGYAGTGKSNLTIDTSGHSTFYGNVNADNRLAFKESNFGYSSSYKVVQYGTCGSTSGIALGVDLTGNSSGGFTGNEIVIPNNIRILAPNAANNAYHGVLMFDDDDDLLLGATNYNIDSTYALKLDGSNNNATFAGDVTVEGSLALGKADTASGHINAKELMTFNIDTDNDDTNRYFAWYTNGADGSGTELLKILETGAATFAGDVGIGDAPDEAGHGLEIHKDGSSDSIGILIHNKGTNAADDAKISFETQGQRDISIGIDRSDSFFKISHSGDLGTNDWQTFDASGNATFAGDVNLGATDKGSNTTLSLYTNDGYKTTVKYQETSGYYGFSTEYNGDGNTFAIRRHSNSQAGVAVMTMNRDDANTTFAGTVDAVTIGSNTAALRGTSLTIDSRLTLHDGEIDNNSGDLTLDSVGDIILDADGGDVMFRDGGTGFIQFTHSSGDAVITSNVDDKDIIFKGYDGGSLITALTLDMSEGGNATFAGSVAIGTTPQFNRELLVKGEIAAFAQDSGDNQILMGATSTQTNISATYGSAGSYVPMQFETGGAIRMSISEDGEVGIGTTPASGVALDIREDSTTTAVDVRNANASGYGLYVAGGDTSAQYAFKAADYNNNTLFTVLGDGVSTFNYRVNMSGNLYVTGSVSKGSGSFKIDHPLEDKKDTHHLVHSFIEGPQADLIYRGMVDLVGGTATINIDTEAGMSEGTFVLLNTNTQCFTSNETNWDAVKGKVEGNILTIECQNSSSTATVSWMVVGERQDQHMIDTNWTDENGKVIVEPLKEI